MKKFTDWIKTTLKPATSNIADGKIEEVLAALADQAIRQYWMKLMETELWTLNVKVDRLMDSESERAWTEREWQKLSMRRNAILYVLNLILDAKNDIESERDALEGQNRKAERITQINAAAALDVRQS